MDIQLSAAAAEALEHLLARGFATPAEAIEAAVLAFEAAAPEDDWDDEYTAEVVAMAETAAAEVERGMGVPFDPAMFEAVKRRGRELRRARAAS